MSWQRARQPDQIAQRRDDILDAASRLYEAQGFDTLSLNGIAREAGLAKSAVYRYFESKEEIFIHFLKEEWGEWITEIEAGLAPLAGSNDAGAVARTVAAIYAGRPRFVDLASIASRTLEHNLSLEAVVEFKTGLMPYILRASNAVHAAIPAMQMDQVRALLVHAYALASGLWPNCNPAAVVQAALEQPELQIMKVEFERDLADGLRFLILGIMADT